MLRCLYLESQGYSVTVTELVGWEHSLKNELILAHYTGHRKRSAAERMQAIAEEFGLHELLARRYPRVAEVLAADAASAPEPGLSPQVPEDGRI